MTRIFVSYRRIDTAKVTAQICRAIRGKYGRESVFIDVDSIAPGTDFREAIRAYINQSSLMLVVMGERWLEAHDYRGTHSILDPKDYVRIEVEAAFAREIPVIPVLVDDTPMPDQGGLPDTLSRLPFLNAVDVRGGTGFRAGRRRLMQAIEKSLQSPPPPPLDAPPARKEPAVPPPTTGHRRGKALPDLLSWAGAYTVITGSRRSLPVRFPCDILLSVDWADFVLLDHLPAADRRRIVRDVEFTTDWHQKRVGRDVFQSLIVGVGAPDVNFAGLLLNETALFRFLLDQRAYRDLFDLFEKMQQMGHRDQVEFMLRHEKELRQMVERLCPGTLLDPLAARFEVGRQRLMRFAHGFVSLAGHPFVAGGMAILAGGISGPCTAGAVALLAGREIFDPHSGRFAGIESRPLGGIFQRKDPSREPPHDVLHIEDDLEWVTPPYDRGGLTRRLHEMQKSASRPEGITREDVERMLALVEQFEQALVRPAARAKRAFHVIIPIGGRGSRMSAVTQDKISKAELPIPLRPTRRKNLAKEKKLREETVLGMIVRALCATGMVEDVLLLTREELLAAHRSLGRELADRYGIPIRVESDGSEPFVAALGKRLAGYANKTAPTTLMMGDTLIHPEDLKRLFRWAAQEKPLVGVAYAEVPADDVSRYGMLDVDEQNRVYRILEKPGKSTTRAGFQGVQVLFPYLRWDRFLADSRASDPVGLLSSAIGWDVPVHAFPLQEPVYDCGSPSGYERAREAGEEGRLW